MLSVTILIGACSIRSICVGNADGDLDPSFPSFFFLPTSTENVARHPVKTLAMKVMSLGPPSLARPGKET